MKIKLGELKKLIRNSLAGSHPEEAYDKELIEDPTFEKKSVYAPDEVKKKIKSWMKDMKLSSK